ncbi:MFS transporter [Dietzia sp.]|uniref:MFS transporter n=1 Tax=Dietzia sp. TaxID=1871616 RepID=UPI002FD8A431
MTLTETTTHPGTDRRWLALAVLMLPVLLVSVDNTVLSFAVPAIAEGLHASGTQVLWIVDTYPLILASLLVPMGSFADRFGRRRLLLIGALGFTVVSVLAAFAPSAEALIAARAGMALFGAALMPATLSLIRNIISDPTERRTAIAIWSACFAGGAALGPIVGGFLLEHYYWGSVFLLSVPVLAPLLLLGPALVPESRDPAPGPVDAVSIALSLATMTPLVYGIKTLASSGDTAIALSAVILAVLAGAAFVRRQLRGAEPMLDVRLFAVPAFSGSVLANLLSVFSLVGFLFFASQHLQLVSGNSPMAAGVLLVPGLAASVVAGLLVVRLVRHMPPGAIMSLGLLANAGAYVLVAVAALMANDVALVVAFVVLGVGIGAAETLSNDVILSSVPAPKSGAASAISETAYETGAVLGTAILGSVLTAVYRASVTVPSVAGEAGAAAARETLGGGLDVAGALGGRAGAELAESARHAFDMGAVATSAVGFAAMVLAALIVRRTVRGRIAEAAE